MNLKTKLRIGAVAAAMLAANGAYATIATGGNSSLVLVVFDDTSATGKITGMFDLGIDYATFAPTNAYTNTPGQTITWNLAAGTVGSTVGTPPATTGAWSAAWSAITAAGVAGDQWFVAAFDNAGLVGARGIVSTVTPGQEANIASSSPSNIPTASIALTNGITAHNALPTNSSPTPGGSVITDTSSDGYIDNFWSPGLNWGNTMPFQTSGGYGTSLSAFKLVNTAALTSTEYAGDFVLSSNGVLTYTTAPIPEPSTYALLAAGLVLVAGIARRRLS